MLLFHVTSRLWTHVFSYQLMIKMHVYILESFW